MECRPHCGMCCIAPSINLPLPGMPRGKPAGIACVNLDPKSLMCRIWGSDQYPALCRGFAASSEVCGNSQQEAEAIIRWLEQETRPVNGQK